MTIKPIIFDEILFGNLAPWRTDILDESNFRNILNQDIRSNSDKPQLFFHALTKGLRNYNIHLNIEPIPDFANLANFANLAELQNDFSMLSIPPFFDKASEFYFYLINNENKRIMAAIHSKVKNARVDIDKEYHVSGLLDNLEHIIAQLKHFKQSDKRCLYVINALKISIFSLYQNISAIYHSFTGSAVLSDLEILNFIDEHYHSNKDNPLTISYIFSQFLNSKNKLISVETISNKKDKKPPFTARKTDFRPGYKGKLSFDDIVNPDLFIKLEEQLYLNDYIDNDYNFTNIHNKKKELAAIFHHIINKKYFREKNFKHHNPFKKADYRQYLDNRYNVDTSEQFRKCNDGYIKSLLDKYYWLENIPACR